MDPSPRYDRLGHGYHRYRQPDPRLAAAITLALGQAQTVLNVGAGTGSYEPTDRTVMAVEPSAVMIAQRPPGAAPVVQASAEKLPFEAQSFDAALLLLTIHHWADWRAGLREVLRVARRVILLTWNPAHPGFWLTQDYFPQLLALDQRIFPPLSELQGVLPGSHWQPLPIPHDCTDGFGCAYWRRPRAYLDLGVRQAISSFNRIGEVQPGLNRLTRDLDDGSWEQRCGHLLAEEELDLGYGLLVGA